MRLCFSLLISLFVVVFSAVCTMHTASAAPSGEDLQQKLQSASQVVEFSHIAGSEGGDTAEVRVRVGSTVAVRVRCTGGHRAVMLSAEKVSAAADSDAAAAAVAAAAEKAKQIPSSSEDVLKLVEEGPTMPEGLSVVLPTPFTGPNAEGLGLVGAPTPYVSTVTVDTAGLYTVLFGSVRPWAPQGGAVFVLTIIAVPE